ncbi:MAG: hypothetical protein NTV73_08825 [Hyphomicrobiales bacterium]|nr:hypothetical protein [Hyphomicrobiales bacterium]
MRLLVPQVLACPFVDRYDIWVNTAEPRDLAFLDALPKLDSRVRLVAQPDGRVDGSRSIGAFHRTAMDEDTIYIRFDDDIIWIQPDFFERHLEFRIARPQYLLTMPLIINNAICSALLGNTHKIAVSRPIKFEVFDRIGYSDGMFAEALHMAFTEVASTGGWGKLHGGAYPIAISHFSINCICWFGRTLAAFPDLIASDEEVDWTVHAPVKTGMANCFATDTIVSHYAFYPQRAYLDRSAVLEKYERLARAQPAAASLLDSLALVIADIERSHPRIGRDGGEVAIPLTLRRRLRNWWRVHRQAAPEVRIADGLIEG